MSLLLKHDPGPCPVDDCPHTTCVAVPVGLRADDVPITSAQLPARDKPRTPRSARLIVSVPPSKNAFTTATYQRAKHRQVRR